MTYSKISFCAKSSPQWCNPVISEPEGVNIQIWGSLADQPSLTESSESMRDLISKDTGDETSGGRSSKIAS